MPSRQVLSLGISGDADMAILNTRCAVVLMTMDGNTEMDNGNQTTFARLTKTAAGASLTSLAVLVDNEGGSLPVVDSTRPVLLLAQTNDDEVMRNKRSQNMFYLHGRCTSRFQTDVATCHSKRIAGDAESSLPQLNARLGGPQPVEWGELRLGLSGSLRGVPAHAARPGHCHGPLEEVSEATENVQCAKSILRCMAHIKLRSTCSDQ